MGSYFLYCMIAIPLNFGLLYHLYIGIKCCEHRSVACKHFLMHSVEIIESCLLFLMTLLTLAYATASLEHMAVFQQELKSGVTTYVVFATSCLQAFLTAVATIWTFKRWFVECFCGVCRSRNQTHQSGLIFLKFLLNGVQLAIAFFSVVAAMLAYAFTMAGLNVFCSLKHEGLTMGNIFLGMIVPNLTEPFKV